ncbi:MAG: hypothetical protein D3910_07930, partial [Candidatus Electrothrix sp. ATG2]|nr:hypothetical protein [Candidatus Electrothrix sp. ATG2]
MFLYTAMKNDTRSKGAMKAIPEEQWHRLAAENILSLLQTNQEQGLTQEEAEERL